MAREFDTQRRHVRLQVVAELSWRDVSGAWASASEDLRIKRGRSQDVVADKTGSSRAPRWSVERGEINLHIRICLLAQI